jgi:hypothetical protein
MSERPRGFDAIRQARRNFHAYDAPFAVRVHMWTRNNWLKVIRRDTCCGNDGEPGC